MPRNYSRTRAWGCAANAGGWLPAQTDVMSWCPVNGTGSSRRRKLLKRNLESDELLQQKRRAYYLSDEGFEEYKKFLSDPDQKKFCFKGYYYVEVKEQDDKELLGAMGRVVYE